MGVGGTWNVTVKTPMGEQKGTLTVEPAGDTFTGQLESSMGAAELNGGTVSGERLSWKMDMKVPMPMTLDCEATVSGDTLSGTVRAGAFGSMALEGTRAA